MGKGMYSLEEREIWKRKINKTKIRRKMAAKSRRINRKK
jgi:hypothetical protein